MALQEKATALLCYSMRSQPEAPEPLKYCKLWGVVPIFLGKKFLGFISLKVSLKG